MKDLTIISTPMFNDQPYDVYSDGNRIYMTRQQIGRALEYRDPQKAIDNIHAKHSHRLNSISVPLKTRATDGKMYNTILYSQRGIMEICRWSRQPLADKFMDWVWDIIEAYRDGSLVPYSTDEHVVTDVMSQEQIEKLIDDKLEQFKTNELSQLKERVMALPESDSNSDVSHVTNAVPVIPSTMQEPIDVVRSIIKPLAIALNDNTNGYNSTFRNVYDAMGVSWATRLTRYKNKHHNKNKPSKMKLIATDPKLFKLYVQTVNAMLAKVK